MKIAVYAFDGITMFHLAAPLIVFETASSLGLAPEWRTTSGPTDGRSIRTSEGVVMDDLAGPETTADADVLVFPSWPIELPPPDDDVVAIVHEAHRRGARIAGLCLGAFPVAASGVLDGRTAVTHWAAADALAAQRPAVDVQRSALYIDHGDVLTSAGTASAIDACLHIVRAGLGSAAASTVARHLVVAPHRDGDQAQFVEHPIATPARSWADRRHHRMGAHQPPPRPLGRRARRPRLHEQAQLHPPIPRCHRDHTSQMGTHQTPRCRTHTARDHHVEHRTHRTRMRIRQHGDLPTELRRRVRDHTNALSTTLRIAKSGISSANPTPE